jgi:hypothetical protein
MSEPESQLQSYSLRSLMPLRNSPLQFVFSILLAISRKSPILPRDYQLSRCTTKLPSPKPSQISSFVPLLLSLLSRFLTASLQYLD